MKTHQEYKSFNREKSIEELQYSMHFHIENLQTLKEELLFLQFLMVADIFKNKVMNLFEDLEKFKKELEKHLHKCGILIIDANFHANQITNKMECDELACDNYFINTHNELEQNILQFTNNTSKLKLDIFNYLQGVIMTE
jgi:hypothetical protein